MNYIIKDVFRLICFIIALMNKAVASNWLLVEQNFNNTLHSIFNQTSDCFRVFVGYTDMPKLFEKYDSRLVMIPCNTPTPQNRMEKLRNRGWKLSVCANAIYKQYDNLSFEGGGVFVFPVDADDLVNRRIAEYVNAHPEANGFKSRIGYVYRKGTKYLVRAPYYGGTMNIMNLKKEDLTENLPDTSLCFDSDTAKLLHQCPVRWTDDDVEQLFADLGRPFSRLPFISTVYVLGTGENISDSDSDIIKARQQQARRFHPIRLLKRVNPFNKTMITRRIIEEFGDQVLFF